VDSVQEYVDEVYGNMREGMGVLFVKQVSYAQGR